MRKTITAIAAILITVNLYSQDLKQIGSAGELKAIFDNSKGKVILLNFWATWCKPCVKEFPELVKLYIDYKEKGFELVFISLDVPEDVPKLKPFLQKNEVDFITYVSTFSNPEELINLIDKNWMGAIPATYIYDKEGNLKKSILGNRSYKDFETEITKILD